VSKYKIIITLILFCLFQTTPSISLELKIPKIGDLEKITEDIKKEIEKKEPEVKKEEVKKEEVKKEEVKKEEVVDVGQGSFINKRIELNSKDKDCKGSIIYYFYPDNYYEAFKGCTKEYAKDWSEVGERADTSFGTWKIFKEKKIQFDTYEEFEKEIYSDDENKVDIITTRKEKFIGGDGEFLKDVETKIRIDVKKFIGFVGASVATGSMNRYPFSVNNGWGVQISSIDNKDTYYYAVKTQYEEEQKAQTEIQSTEASRVEKIKKRCREHIQKIENDQKSKTIGGYQNFHFGMSQKDARIFIQCKKNSNNEIVLFDDTTDNQSYVVQKLYKYQIAIRFKDEKINKIDLMFLMSIRDKISYSGASGIEEFKEIKKVVLDKYKLISKPTKVSIDEFNNKKYGTVNWVLKSNVNDNLVLLVLDQSPGTTKFIYNGQIQYLSSEESIIYKKKLDSKIVKTDDL